MNPSSRRARRQVLAGRGLALALFDRADEADRAFADAWATRVDGAAGRSALLAAWAEASLWAGLPRRALERAAAALSAASGDAQRVLPSLTRAWAELELGRRPAPGPADAAPAKPRRRSTRAPRRRGPCGRSMARRHGGVRGREPAVGRAQRPARSSSAAGRLARPGDARGDPDVAACLRATLDAAVAIGFRAPRRARPVARSGSPGSGQPRLRGGRAAGDPLTARERQVLELVERGRTNSEIARRMGLGRPTVARILSNAMTKLGALSRTQAVILAAATGGRGTALPWG